MSLNLELILIALGAVGLGYGLFLAILKALPKKLTRENFHQKKEVLKEAKRQKAAILKSSDASSDETIQIMSDELDEDILERMESLKAEEADLASREEFLSTEQSRVDKLAASLSKKEEQAQNTQKEYETKVESTSHLKVALISELEQKADCNAASQQELIKNKLVETRQLECQKLLKGVVEELDISARKKAERVLNAALARYAPNFTWPKSINTIEITSEKQLELLQDPDCKLLDDLKELSEAEIRLVTPEEEDRHTSIIRCASGFGPHREAAKLTLLELLPQGRNAWNDARTVFEKHRRIIDQECRELGKKAVNELRVSDIHPEIQMLVGSLNWRTSYRQNQWHHTVEVAALAGIIGNELGIDPDEAKRVGLLHDIGKAIDYRIEGSHAVISGDYADRFGESKLICDTVMSHHADLIVETPLAYILRVADTLSGARPGARVNLEEGYQIRLGAIAESVRSFQGISDLAIMNGGREVHVQVNHKRVKEKDVKALAEAIARKIETDVAFPGQIKVMVSRQFESVTVA